MMVLEDMDEKNYYEILRQVLDEPSDKEVLGKIIYACEQQIDTIDERERIYKHLGVVD